MSQLSISWEGHFKWWWVDINTKISVSRNVSTNIVQKKSQYNISLKYNFPVCASWKFKNYALNPHWVGDA